MTRKCNICLLELEEEAFAWRIKNKQIRSYTCKLCARAKSKEHYKENKSSYIERSIARDRVISVENIKKGLTVRGKPRKVRITKSKYTYADWVKVRGTNTKCVDCQKEIYKLPSRFLVAVPRCSACQAIEQSRQSLKRNAEKREIYLERWRQGLENGSRSDGSISSWVRHYIIKKYGNKCHKCGWSVINPVTGKIPLDVEHIDGNYQHNWENNLDLLCPNCHSLTPTYKALNRGRGRPMSHGRKNKGN